MPVNLYDKLVKAFTGTTGIADAVDIETTGDSNVQGDLDGLRTDIDNIDASILHWQFNSGVTDTSDPGAAFLALNNGAKASATIVTFNTTSNNSSARFDEALSRLDVDDSIFLQQRNATARSVLYRVTGAATLTGTRVNVPVDDERTQGAEFDNNADINVILFFRGRENAIVIDPTTTVDATDATTFSSSLSGLTLGRGDAFRITTAGEPFSGQDTDAAVGDVIVATVASPSLTDVTNWAIVRKAATSQLSATENLFLDQLTSTGGVFGFTSSVQIDRDNVEANYRRVIENQGVAPDLTSLESKVDALYPLTPDVDILTDWADIYDPARASETVNIVPGYSLIADFRGTGASDHYEQAGVTYIAGSGVSDYSGLSDDFHRVFGFRVSAPANENLLWIDDSGTFIPFIDMNATGNFRVNDFTPARAQDEVVTNHIADGTYSTGTQTLTTSSGALTYTLPDYPANTTAQTRSLEIDFEVFLNGNDTLAGGFINIDIPDTDIVSTNDVTHSFFLGFPANRTVTASFRVATRVSGPDYLVDITLLSAPSDITFTVDELYLVQNYTASVVTPRVDNFLILQDESGDFTFSGEHELVIAFHPIHPLDGGPVTQMEVVPVAVDTSTGATTQLNDTLVKVPVPSFDDIRVPDDIEFRTFLPDHFLRHIDLVNILRDRDTKWCYALARLETVTQHAVTQPLELAAGTKIGGIDIPRSASSLVLQATDDSTDLRNTVTLPANYDTFNLLHVTEIAGGERRSSTLNVAMLASSDLGTSELIRSQGNTDFLFNNTTRVLTPEPVATTLYRVELFKF